MSPIAISLLTEEIEMTTFTTEDREEAMRNSCEHCGEPLPTDEIHHCANTEPVPFAGFISTEEEEDDSHKLCRLANDMESSINLRLNRTGVRWAGD
jgi:isocitrate/isopropylmalate dehydrogenase